MRKNSLNFVVDLITLAAILVMIGTGLILKFTLPPGSGGRGLILWGLGRHDWGDVHFWASLALGAALILHIALHWNWVCCTLRRWVRGPGSQTRRRPALENLYGLVFLAAVAAGITGFTFAANASRQTSTAEMEQHERGQDRVGAAPAGRNGAGQGDGDGHNRIVAGFDIRGSTTLGEIEQFVGVPAEHIETELGLPADTPTDVPLRDLRNQLGFEMHAVREVVAAYLEDDG